MKANKGLVAVAAVLAAAAVVCVILFFLRGKGTDEYTNGVQTTVSETTVPAAERAAKAKEQASADAERMETETFPEFAFTVKNGNVIATVMGGDGVTEFRDTEELYTAGAEPTMGEFVLE